MAKVALVPLPRLDPPVGAAAVRAAVVWEALQEALGGHHPAPGSRLAVVDVGGGTGGFAIPLAAQGHDVTVVDPSPDALAALDRRVAEQPVGSVRAVQGDATDLLSVLDEGSADVVLCHGVLEHLDDDQAVAEAMAGIRSLLRPGGLASFVVAQRNAAVVARALAGQFTEARTALASDDGRWGHGDPLPRRFDAEHVQQLLSAAGLDVVSVHGVRVLVDLVPGALVDADSRAPRELLELERALSDDPAFTQLAGSLHVLAVATAPAG